MNLQEFYDCLDQAYHSGAAGAVENFLKEQAASNSHENCGRNLAYLMCLSELGSYYRGVSRFDAAIQCFISADEIIISVLGENSPERATNLNNMAGAYRMKGELDTALKLFLQSMAIYDSLPEKDPFLYASVLNNTALLYHLRGELRQAIDLQEKSVACMEKVPAARAELATGLVNLSGLYRELEKTEGKAPGNSPELLDRALELLAAMPDERSRHAAVLNSKASILAETGQFDEARETYLKALSEFYSENVDYALTCGNLARLCAKMNHLDEALPYMRKTLELYTKIFGAGHLRTAETRAELQLLEERKQNERTGTG